MVQIIVEFARGLGRWALRGKALWVYIGANTETEVHPALRNAVPGFGLGQGGRADLDHDRGDDSRTPQGNRGGAAMKGGCRARRGAGAFGKNDQGLAVFQ